MNILWTCVHYRVSPTMIHVTWSHDNTCGTFTCVKGTCISSLCRLSICIYDNVALNLIYVVWFSQSNIIEILKHLSVYVGNITTIACFFATCFLHLYSYDDIMRLKARKYLVYCEQCYNVYIQICCLFMNSKIVIYLVSVNFFFNCYFASGLT